MFTFFHRLLTHDSMAGCNADRDVPHAIGQILFDAKNKNVYLHMNPKIHMNPKMFKSRLVFLFIAISQ